MWHYRTHAYKRNEWSIEGMPRKDKESGREESPATIKMPRPKNPEDRLRDEIAAAGLDPAKFQVSAVKSYLNDDGDQHLQLNLSLTLAPAEAEALIRFLTIKPFNPDKDTVSIGEAEAKLVSVTEIPEPKPAVKLWTGTERRKRSKPKDAEPDLP
jgi:hypothetical protein